MAGGDRERDAEEETRNQMMQNLFGDQSEDEEEDDPIEIADEDDQGPPQQMQRHRQVLDQEEDEEEEDEGRSHGPAHDAYHSVTHIQSPSRRDWSPLLYSLNPYPGLGLSFLFGELSIQSLEIGAIIVREVARICFSLILGNLTSTFWSRNS